MNKNWWYKLFHFQIVFSYLSSNIFLASLYLFFRAFRSSSMRFSAMRLLRWMSKSWEKSLLLLEISLLLLRNLSKFLEKCSLLLDTSLVRLESLGGGVLGLRLSSSSITGGGGLLGPGGTYDGFAPEKPIIFRHSSSNFWYSSGVIRIWSKMIEWNLK